MPGESEGRTRFPSSQSGGRGPIPQPLAHLPHPLAHLPHPRGLLGAGHLSPSPTRALAVPTPRAVAVHAAAFRSCSRVMKEVPFPQNLISRLRLGD